MTSAVKTPVEKHGALHVEGAYLCDAHNEKVQLYGMSTHGMAWYPQYVCKETLQFLRDEWKVNAVRLAMYTDEHKGYCSDGDKTFIKNLMIEGIKAATAWYVCFGGLAYFKRAFAYGLQGGSNSFLR